MILQTVEKRSKYNDFLLRDDKRIKNMKRLFLAKVRRLWSVSASASSASGTRMTDSSSSLSTAARRSRRQGLAAAPAVNKGLGSRLSFTEAPLTANTS